MKTPLTIAFLLLAQIALAQLPAERAFAGEDDDPVQLSGKLVSGYTSERDRVASIFQWITQHISYYRPSPLGPRKRAKRLPDELDPDSAELKPLNERVAIKVLKDRRTHCEGYARLFKSLCDHAGIESKIISGYARTDMGWREEMFKSNHSWNAVRIDSAWYLLDVTWASGYTSYSSGDFIRQYNNYYFLTPPAEFIRHHYPDDLRWALLDHADAPDEFRRGPFRQRSYVKYIISSYLPQKGTIDAYVGDTLRFELETPPYHHNLSIVSDSLWDSASLSDAPVYAYVRPVGEETGRKIQYVYPVESDKVEWIHIIYNGDAILRYRLNIRKRTEVATKEL